jgi:hypothetical protein
MSVTFAIGHVAVSSFLESPLILSIPDSHTATHRGVEREEIPRGAWRADIYVWPDHLNLNN